MTEYFETYELDSEVYTLNKASLSDALVEHNLDEICFRSAVG